MSRVLHRVEYTPRDLIVDAATQAASAATSHAEKRAVVAAGGGRVLLLKEIEADALALQEKIDALGTARELVWACVSIDAAVHQVTAYFQNVADGVMG